MALGLALLGVGGMVGPSVIETVTTPGEPGRLSLTALPEDAPEQGLVYGGLKPAAKNSLCAGSYQLYEATCTYGPDPAPPGLTVRRDVAPVTTGATLPAVVRREFPAVPLDAEIARDEGGSALTLRAPALVPEAAPGQAAFVLGPNEVACEGDGRSGKRVQVLYVHDAAAASRYARFLNSFRTWAGGVDRIFDASAAETGGSRHVRFITTPECRVDVAEVQLPTGALDSFTRSIDALRDLGYNRTDRKYLIFSDTNVYCGIASYVADRRPGRSNRNNSGPSYARVDAGCWSSVVAAQELTRSLGAVLADSPNASGAGGCLDDHDLLCYPDRSGKPVRAVCPRSHESRLDCGHDDYFSTDPAPGSYLARHWNVAQSDFLLRSDGGEEATPATPDEPAPTPGASTPPPRPSPSAPSPTPALPSPSASTGPQVTPAPTPSESATPVPDPPATAGEPAVGPAIVPVAYVPGGTPGPQERAEATPPAATRPAGPPAGPAAAPAVLEIRDATSTSVRLTWSAEGTGARYRVLVDGVPVATTTATKARLIGLRPDATYRVEVRSSARYRAVGAARTAPAARPVQNSWFVLTNSLTGGAAELYAARSAAGTPLTLNGADGGAQQQWQLTPSVDNTYTLVSKATGKCVVPLGGAPLAGAPLVQGECAESPASRWTLHASAHGFTLRSAIGGLVVGVGTQRFGTRRVLVLQPDADQRHQSWTAVPG